MPKAGFGAVRATKRSREARGPEAGRARELRAKQTVAEGILWERLRDRRFAGLKFRRQFPVEGFIADFCCPEVKLVVEVDGGIHEESQQKAWDQNRDVTLNRLGFQVLRLTNDEIEQDLRSAIRRIAEVAKVFYNP